MFWIAPASSLRPASPDLFEDLVRREAGLETTDRNDPGISPQLIELARLNLVLGRTESAQANLEEVLALAVNHQQQDVLTQTHLLKCEIELRRGDLDAASGYLDKAAELVSRHPELCREVALAGFALAGARAAPKEIETWIRFLDADIANDPLAQMQVIQASLACGESPGTGLPGNPLDDPDLEWRRLALKGEIARARGDSPGATRSFESAKKTLDTLLRSIPEEVRHSYLQTNEGILLRDRAASTSESDSEMLETEAGRAVFASLLRLFDSGQDVEGMMTGAMDAVVELTGADRGFVLLFDENGIPQFHAEYKMETDSLPRVSQSAVRRVRETGRPLFVASTANDSWAQSQGSIQELGLASILVAPILLKKEVTGVVYIDRAGNDRPFGDQDCLMASLFARRLARPLNQTRVLRQRSEQIQRLETVVHQGLQELVHRHRYSDIIGKSESVRKLFVQLERVASVDYPVILEGETGTGKEMVAKAIHANSRRAKNPFIAINCAAVSESLLESELFGHVKGAFTGADSNRQGVFEVASGGTLLLDEIEEMSPAMQAKLLRVLEEGRVRPVGGKREITVDTRVLSTTNRPLRILMDEKKFREDLYYRLATFVIILPPLRERGEDLHLIAEHFLEQVARETGRPRKELSPEALAILSRYAWPGNVRELRNEMRRMGVIPGESVRAGDLSPHIAEHPGKKPSLPTEGSLVERLAIVEREIISAALAENDGNIAQTARALGADKSTLRRRMQKLGMRE